MSAGRPPAPGIPARIGGVLGALGAFLAPLSAWLMLVDYGTHVDGPGVGISEGFEPLWGWIALAFLGGLAMVSAALLLGRDHLPRTLKLAAVGAAVSLMPLFAGVADRMLHASWERVCLREGAPRGSRRTLMATRGWACRSLGSAYEDGWHEDKDVVKAEAFFARGCERLDSKSCARLLGLAGARRREEVCARFRAECGPQAPVIADADFDRRTQREWFCEDAKRPEVLGDACASR